MPLGIVNAFRLGALNAASSAKPPGSASAKIPAPVRITVLSLWKGRQAIPIRGSHTYGLRIRISSYAGPKRLTGYSAATDGAPASAAPVKVSQDARSNSNRKWDWQ